MEDLQKYHTYLISEVRRRLIGECQERTLKCLHLLSNEEIWFRPNSESNSVGNLVLHLCGNIKQWLLGEDDVRTRQAEFDEQGPIDKAVLKQMIVDLMEHSERILENCMVEDLLKEYRVQGFHENGISILIHITEHFSYHVGQITYYVKARKSIDVGYYKDIDLDKK